MCIWRRCFSGTPPFFFLPLDNYYSIKIFFFLFFLSRKAPRASLEGEVGRDIPWMSVYMLRPGCPPLSFTSHGSEDQAVVTGLLVVIGADSHRVMGGETAWTPCSLMRNFPAYAAVSAGIMRRRKGAHSAC